LAGKTSRIAWRRILHTVGIVLGLGLLAQQAWQGYLALLEVQACMVRPSPLAGALGLYSIAYFVQMAAWALIMRYLSAPLSPNAVIEGYALSFLPRYIPGSIWGYLSRNEWLAQTHGVGYGTSTTASLLEAAMLLVTAGVLGVLYWLPNQLAGWLSAPGQLLVAVVGIGSAWVAWRLVPWVTTRLGKKRISLEIQQGQSLGLWGATCFLYVAFWGLQGGALLAIAQALCGDFVLGLGAATAAFGLAWAIGFLIVFVPAGLGVREWTLSALLVAFATLEPGQATLIAVVSRFGLIVAEVIVLLIGFHGQIERWWSRRNLIEDNRTLE
jgi:glycosyltransferase 2 family protein